MWWLQALILGGLYQVNKHPFSTVLLAMVNSSFGFFFFFNFSQIIPYL